MRRAARLTNELRLSHADWVNGVRLEVEGEDVRNRVTFVVTKNSYCFSINLCYTILTGRETNPTLDRRKLDANFQKQ